MPEFTVRSDAVNVEQIMEQIRARIREKRGVDYTEQQIREMANVKLEKFLDPRGVRSDLLEQFQRTQAATTPPAPPNYAFGEETLYETHRGPLRAIRRLLHPILKLLFNPNPLIQALHIQAGLNTINAERETVRRGLDQLQFEVLHNLVIETTRLSIEVKNLKMRVESLSGRLEFNERRARALESVVVYRGREPEDESSRPRPDEPAVTRQGVSRPPSPPQSGVSGPSQEPAVEGFRPLPDGSRPLPDSSRPPMDPSSRPPLEGPGQRSRRRRRRRGRRGGGSAAATMGEPGATPAGEAAAPIESSEAEPEAPDSGPDDSPHDPSTGSGPNGPSTSSGSNDEQ